MPQATPNTLSQQEIDLLDLIETVVFVLEPNEAGDVVYVAFNDFCSRTLDLPRDRIIGRTARAIYPGRLGELAYSRHVQAVESAKPMSFETHLPVDGNIHHLKTQLRPLFDEQGKLLRVIGTSREVTAENAVRALQLDSQAMESEVEQFVNLAAHDLRAPMRNANTLTAMLKDGFQDLGDGKLDIINMLEKVTHNTLSLIGDVLKHADSARTQQNNSPSEFDLEHLFIETMAMLDPMDKVHTRSNSCILFGDATVTQIVLRNLIDNAIKHNSDAELRLSLSASADDDQRKFYRLALEDNGSGFPDPATAFSESERKTIDNGGFGLLGVRRLVKTRGGNIRAENLSGGGALITFTLPGQLLESAEASTAVEQIEPHADSTTTRKTA